MAPTESRSPLERLRVYYDSEELACPACRYEDTEGGWESETDGRQVYYRHECPRCGAIQEHTLEVPGG